MPAKKNPDPAAVKAAMTAAKPADPEPTLYLSTGSTLLNLAISNRAANGGFRVGSYYLFVGDSSSGKSWLTMTCMAEACIDKRFADYRLVHDNPEDGTLMDVRRYFGKLEDRLEQPPNGTSQTVEEFYDNLNACLAAGKPFVYVLDSMDVLETEPDLQKKAEHKKARHKARTEGRTVEVAGSFGTAKSKLNSNSLRTVIPRLKKLGAVLIIITQTRDKIGQMPVLLGDGKTRGGGHALKFYATVELWTSVAGKVKKRVLDKDRTVGITSQVQTKKNRITGREVKVKLPILYHSGLDDVGSMVDFLVEEGHWKKASGISADEFQVKGSREQVVAAVEALDDGVYRLRKLTARVWRQIEEQSKLTRRNPYAG